MIRFLQNAQKIINWPLFGLFFLSVPKIFAQEDSPSIALDEEAIATEATTSIEAEEEIYDFESMATYELFWPIMPGKLPGDEFYRLKLWRDRLTGYLSFSKLGRSKHFKKLANKRLVEAEKLLEIQRYSPLPKTLERAKQNLIKGLNLLSKTRQTVEYHWLKKKYKRDVKKHTIVLERMKEKAKEEQKAIIETSLKDTHDLIREYELEFDY